MQKRPKIMTELSNILKDRGHECVRFIGMNENIKFEWCQKDICIQKQINDDMKKRQKKQEVLLKKLEKEGHECITIQESYPMTVVWCGKKVCIERKE
jgi:hypothetical protein